MPYLACHGDSGTRVPPTKDRERVQYLETRLSDVPVVRLRAVGVKNLGHGERRIDPSALVEGVFDLKANPRDLLVKYFDASLYFAHWLYLDVAFRFSKDAVDVKAFRRYAGG